MTPAPDQTGSLAEVELGVIAAVVDLLDERPTIAEAEQLQDLRRGVGAFATVAAEGSSEVPATLVAGIQRRLVRVTAEHHQTVETVNDGVVVAGGVTLRVHDGASQVDRQRRVAVVAGVAVLPGGTSKGNGPEALPPFSYSVACQRTLYIIALFYFFVNERRVCYSNNMTTTTLAAGVVHQIPADIRAALLSDESVRERWEDLTPLARNEWLCWIISNKRPETRRNHLERMMTELLQGKRRPCCWMGCDHR